MAPYEFLVFNLLLDFCGITSIYNYYSPYVYLIPPLLFYQSSPFIPYVISISFLYYPFIYDSKSSISYID